MSRGGSLDSKFRVVDDSSHRFFSSRRDTCASARNVAKDASSETVAAPWHMVRFHGVLAPNAKLREQVVVSAEPSIPPNEKPAPNPVQLPLFGKLFDETEAEVRHARRKLWAWLLEHVFTIDVNVPSFLMGAFPGA